MSRHPCPRENEGCPLFNTPAGCHTDVHHTAYPRPDYSGRIERDWRELPINKAQICRAIHDAIHASGYVPEKPFRQEMAQELWNGAITERSQTELEHQLALGELVLREEWPEDVA